MTVGECRWALYCLSFPMLPVLTSPSAECSYSHSTLQCRPSIVFWVFLGDINHLTLPSKTFSAKFPALPLVTCPKYCSFIRATFPINSLSRPIILIYWYGVLSKKFRASFSSTTSQKTRFYFYPISLMSIPPLHTETLPRPSTSSLWFSTQTWHFCPSRW